MELIW